MVLAKEDHVFFTLPPELHTHIFTLACSPSSTRDSTVGLPYYTAFITGISLSLVSKYVNAASAPARHRAVVIYGWQGMLAFERIVSHTSTGTGSRSRVRYLTLVADELPQDPVSTFPQYQFSGIKDKVEVERLLLEVIARILRVIGEDLYELELGFQAIENIKDPLGYLSFSGPGSALSFPTLQTMSYACSPSNALPWVTTSSPFDEPNIPQIPHLSCPCLEELTVVCSDVITSENRHAEGTEPVEDDGPIVNSTAGDTNNADDRDSELPSLQVNQFPSLEKLTILASKPEQALAALDVNEAAWDVGSALALDIGGLEHKVGSPEPSPTLFPEDENIGSTWPPQALQTIVLRPKSHWNERWASLRDVVQRQREEMEKETERDEEAKSAPDARFEIFVLKTGEQL
ncbi:hypothetical protein BT96DRAFT_926975 [Gymnopus androsaceus JB14]|uniref:Uncharacterized protein n=1 Tax=Gymnopus androsaceus JB14 TaxID=1447944 RepID=A0A6A4GTY6_9AGAR|nr:hypothetical protein BT96DRAFT_926975 [Gymnopus androsaceus JB14]